VSAGRSLIRGARSISFFCGQRYRKGGGGKSPDPVHQVRGIVRKVVKSLLSVEKGLVCAKRGAPERGGGGL